MKLLAMTSKSPNNNVPDVVSALNCLSPGRVMPTLLTAVGIACWYIKSYSARCPARMTEVYDGVALRGIGQGGGLASSQQRSAGLLTAYERGEGPHKVLCYMQLCNAGHNNHDRLVPDQGWRQHVGFSNSSADSS